MKREQRLQAWPVREGYIRTLDGPVSVWREYLWNTGEVSTLALRPDLETSPDETNIREFDLPDWPTFP